MQYALGIDIGPTHTCAAVRTLRKGAWSEPEPVSLGGRTAAAPSALYLDDDGYLLTGDLALQAGAAAPERLITGFHARIGDEVPVLVAGEPFTPQSLSTVIVGWIVDQVAADRGRPARRVTLTHPAGWGPYRRELLESALREAEIPDVALVAAPLAAVHGNPAVRPAGRTVFGVFEPGSAVSLVGTSEVGDGEVLACDEGTGDLDAVLELAQRSAIDPRRLGGVLLCGDPATFPAAGPRPPCPVLISAEPRLTVAMGAAKLASIPSANAVETTLLPKVTAQREVAERPLRPPVDITPFEVPTKKPAWKFGGSRSGLTKAAVIAFGVIGMLLAFEGHLATGNPVSGSAAPQASCSAPPVAGKDGRGC